MKRQSITFTDPNEAWLEKMVNNQEYASKSDIVNDLIRKERKKEDVIEAIKCALIQGESSGISNETPNEIMTRVIERKRKNGEL